MTSYVSSTPTKCEPLAVVYKRDCNPDQDSTYQMEYPDYYKDERADDIKPNFTDELHQTLDKLRLLTNFYNSSTILHQVLYVSKN